MNVLVLLHGCAVKILFFLLFSNLSFFFFLLLFSFGILSFIYLFIYLLIFLFIHLIIYFHHIAAEALCRDSDDPFVSG